MAEFKFNEHKGLDKSGDLFNKKIEFAEDILNAYVEKSPKNKGSIKQRQGCATIVDHPLGATTKIRYIKNNKWKNGTSEMICRGGSGWYRVASREFVALDIGRTADAKGQSCSYDDYFIMTDGGKARKSTSGHVVTDLSLDAAMPAYSSACLTHRNRVVLNEVGTMLVHATKVAAPFGADAFSATSDYWYIDLSKYLPEWDEPIAFNSIADYVLVVVGTKFVTYINLPEIFNDIVVIGYKELYPVSAYGMQRVGNNISMCLSSGFNALASTNTYERLKVDDLSKYIASYWDELMRAEPDKKSICSVLNSSLSQIYVTFHGDITNTLVFSLIADNFVGRYQFHTSPYSWCEDEGKDIYFGGADGNIYQMGDNYYTDNGNAIAFVWTPVYVDGEKPGQFKAPREAELLCHTNTPVTLYLDYWFALASTPLSTVELFIDATISRWREGTWRTGTWRSVGRDLVLNPNLNERGKFIGFSVRHNQLGARVEIPYLLVKYIIEGIK